MSSRRFASRRLAVPGLVAALALACTNNPYPAEDDAVVVRYRALPSAPKTLDPAVSYSALEHAITANLYETLLEYHYLKRPYTLMPGAPAHSASTPGINLPVPGMSYFFTALSSS